MSQELGTNTTEETDPRSSNVADEDLVDRVRLFEVGGRNGHERESLSGAIRELYRSYRWKPIPNCTGRYTCRDHAKVSHLQPLDLLEAAGIRPRCGLWEQYRIRLPHKTDDVLVVPLDSERQTGIITYVKKKSAGHTEAQSGESDNDLHTYVHTLNAPSGFRRKLEALGIALSEMQELSTDDT